jgi:APA family basic amino acid/polyamine antiporter
MSALDRSSTSAPRRVLSTFDDIVLVAGLIVGAGIFRSPPVVAANAPDGWSFLAVWAAGGLIALVGALCYAQLASAYPHPGGEYHVLRCAFGVADMLAGLPLLLIGRSRAAPNDPSLGSVESTP